MTKKMMNGMKMVALALSLAGAATGCGSNVADSSVSESAIGSIGFNLEMPADSKIKTVTYVISNPNAQLTQKMGSFQVAGDGKSFSVTIDGLKAGSGYHIELTGIRSGDYKDKPCVGKADFEVSRGMTTTVKVHMSCPGLRTTGTIMVNGEINVCAVVESAVAMLNADGKSYALTSLSTDDEVMGPMALTSKWTATPASAGMFDSATSANATFTCLTDGKVSLALDATDGDCGDKMTIEVDCSTSGGSAGAGGSEAGAGGSAAGAGGSEAGAGGSAAGAGGSEAGAGGSAAGAGGSEAGAGGSAAGAGGSEAGAGGSAAGAGGSAAGAGGEGGMGGMGGSEAGMGGSAAGMGGMGGSGGGGVGEMSAACRMCVTTEMDGVCAEGLTAYESSPKYMVGKALETCVRTNKCASASGGYALIDCYCGTTEFGACSAGTAPGNGVCKAELEAAVETTVVADVIARVTNPAYAAGLLDQELGCESAICNTLSTVCEF